MVTFEIGSGNPTGAEYATMSFISKTSTITADGKLMVTGDLAATRVVRRVTTEPSEAYAGAQYGDPVSFTTTRQIKLVSAGSPQISDPNGVMHIVGSASVIREDYPQFLDAVSTPGLPTELINDEKCENPSIIGEDYHGADCTGTVIASINNAMVPTGAPSGEGFYGFEPIVTPDRNSATIALNLQSRRCHPSFPPGDIR